MRQGKFAVVLSVLGALILVVAACAPAATPTPTVTPTPGGVATLTPGVATPTPTPVPGEATPTPEGLPTLAQLEAKILVPTAAQYGGILWRTSATPPYWDEQRAMTAGVVVPTSPTRNSLVRFHPYAQRYLPQWIEPDLAERWEASADGLVYTFYLRRGVKFHDGRPFTAKDVKHSLEKLTDPKRSFYSVELGVIDRVEIVDDYTVKVYLKYSSGLFLPLLAQGMSTMQPEHVKDVNYRTTAFVIGTGPFKLKSVSPGVEMVYEKNPDYFRAGRPYLDGVVLADMTEAGGQNAFIGGRLDIGPTPRTDSDWEALARFAPEAKIVVNPNLPSTRGLVINFAREGPWQDVRVRRAMAMVFDYPGAVKAAMGDTPMGDHRVGFFMSEPFGIGLPWSEYEKAWWLDRPLEVRIAEAKRLLALAGYPDGFKGGIMVATGIVYEKPALFAEDLWKRYLNIDLAHEAVGGAAAVDRRARLAFDFTVTGFVATLAEPEQMLASIYTPQGGSNFGKYSHPKVIELYDQLTREPNQERRLALIHQAERLLMADIPVIPFHKGHYAFSDRPYLKNFFQRNPFHSSYYTEIEIMWFDRNDPTWAKRKI